MDGAASFPVRDGSAGEIYVSKRDLERMPDDFPAKIEKAAQEKGGSWY